ncbi:uncharacterized protein LOC144926942 [Branchiostoma floridae x Branchiostoma belcheri]
MGLSCAANELIVIDDTFFGRRENGPRCGCNPEYRSCDACQENQFWKTSILYYVRKLCQGLQQCDKQPEDIYDKHREHCPGYKKYMEVTYHCEEVNKSVTFGGPSQFRYVSGLAVSSTNEIFVADEPNKRIQVFSMKGTFLRSFSTGDMAPRYMCMGHNDTLWVILHRGLRSRRHTYEYAIQQYSKEGYDLAKFIWCKTSIYGMAWHELSDRIILTRKWPKEAVWLSPTYTPTPTCNMTRLSATRSDVKSALESVTVDTKGNIHVINSVGSRVRKYDKNGIYLSRFGGYGSGAGNLNEPSGICVDSLGRVIVADEGNSRVEMFTAEGEHIRTVAYINQPIHVATGGEGQLVVSNKDCFITIFPTY